MPLTDPNAGHLLTPELVPALATTPEEEAQNRATADALRRDIALGTGLMTIGGPRLQRAGQAMQQQASDRMKAFEGAYGPEGRQLRRALAIAAGAAKVDSATIGGAARTDVADINGQYGVQKAQIGANARDQSAQLQQGHMADQAAVKFSDALDEYKNPGLKPLREARDRADAIEGLITNPDGTLQNLDKRQMTETAIGLARILTGSSRVTQQMINDLVPGSWRGDWNKIAEWFVNEPKGLDQQYFAKIMRTSVHRERQIAQGKMDQAIRSGISAHAGFIAQNPGLAGRILVDHGYDPDTLGLDKLGVQRPVAPPAPAGAPPPAGAPAAPAPPRPDPRQFTRRADGKAKVRRGGAIGWVTNPLPTDEAAP